MSCQRSMRICLAISSHRGGTSADQAPPPPPVGSTYVLPIGVSVVPFGGDHRSLEARSTGREVSPSRRAKVTPTPLEGASLRVIAGQVAAVASARRTSRKRAGQTRKGCGYIPPLTILKKYKVLQGKIASQD